MRPMLFLAATIGIVCSGGAPLAAYDLKWQRYTNARYGASTKIPLGLFTAGRAPDNGDGQPFRSTDGAATVLIYGLRYSSTFDSFAAFKDSTLADERNGGLTITYKASGHGFFVYSGLKSGTIVYTKTIMGCSGIAASLQITYPAGGKAAYDSIVARMARSLAARPSIECR